MPHGCSGSDPDLFPDKAELLKQKKRGRFPDDPVNIKYTRVHQVTRGANYSRNERNRIRGAVIFVISTVDTYLVRIGFMK